MNVCNVDLLLLTINLNHNPLKVVLSCKKVPVNLHPGLIMKDNYHAYMCQILHQDKEPGSDWLLVM